MSADAKTGVTQVYEIYIKTTPQAIWDAITSPEWTAKYGYGGAVEYDLRPGGSFQTFSTTGMRAMGLPEVIIDGEVVESEPPRRLVQTFRFLFSEGMKQEGFTRITWEIEKTASGFTRLTVTHELTGAPTMASAVSAKFSEMGAGGWSWILSDLKTLLETGTKMA